MTTTLDPTQQLPAVREPPQQAVARRTFEPQAPIGNVSALKGLLETQRDSIALMLPKHITPERVFKTLLIAVNRIPDILKCTQASILETINRAAELGLDLSGTLGEAYPVPFNNKVKTDRGDEWRMQLQLIIGYRGMEKLAWQSGEVESIDAEVVRVNDKFIFRKGTDVFVEWSPKIGGERGEIIGAYACVKMKSGGKLARFLPLAEIEKIRQSAKSKDSPAWRNWWDEMARKCALKRTLKDAPLSTEKFTKAMETDAEDHELTDVVFAEVKENGGSAALVDKLKARNGTASQAHVAPPAPPAAATAPQPAAATDADPQHDRQADAGAGASDDSEQPEPPQDDSQEEQFILPSPCNETQAINLLIQRRPAHLDLADAEKAVKDFFKTKMDKKWEKLARATQEAHFKRWIGENAFPWPEPEAT